MTHREDKCLKRENNQYEFKTVKLWYDINVYNVSDEYGILIVSMD